MVRPVPVIRSSVPDGTVGSAPMAAAPVVRFSSCSADAASELLGGCHH